MRLGACGSVETASALGRAGFEFVEPMVVGLLDPRVDEETFQQRKAAFLEAAGDLRAEAFNCFYPREMRITGPDVNLEALREYAAVAARRAVEIGGEVIVLGSGRARSAPEGWQTEKARDQIAAFLAEIAPAMLATGVTVVIEPLGPTECNCLNTVADGHAMMRRVDARAIGLLADSWHIWQNDEPLDEVAPLVPDVTHVHIADPDGRVAPETVKPPLAAFLSVLKRAGYDGRISVECRWTDLPGQAPRVVEAVRDAWAAV